MSLRGYLREHFVDKPAYAALAGISPERLSRLVAIGATPRATYTCDGNSIHSAAFGAIGIQEDLTGEYFRTGCVRWAILAARSPPGRERAAVFETLTRELRAALRGYLEDSAAIEDTIQGFLPGFWDGTFGLCVADPSSGAGIARKEMLQEKLTRLTANGSNPRPAGVSKAELLQLIDDYAEAAMHFSPAEYGRSSRKRLVDDLRPLVIQAWDVMSPAVAWRDVGR